jgi:hypothetical protein
MQHLFWLIPKVLAGRSGPTKDPWNLQHLRHAGIGAVLSVNDGALCHPEELENAGLLYRCLPLSPNAPPRPGDLEHCVAVLPEAYEFVLGNEQLGIATLVHCHSGKDRTGLLMAYYLCRRYGVRAVRPIAFTAAGWEEFALQVLAQSAGRYSQQGREESNRVSIDREPETDERDGGAP